MNKKGFSEKTIIEFVIVIIIIALLWIIWNSIKTKLETG